MSWRHFQTIYLLIPLLPLVSCFVVALGGRWLQSGSHRITIPAMTGSFVLTIPAAIQVFTSGPISLPLMTWLRSGPLRIDAALFIDGLTIAMLLLVAGVSTLVHVFSSRYMQGDPRYARFFAVISLFSGAMLLLVMSANLLMLYMCWEIMGICSYLLISHWAERPSACHAATKAFLINAVADVGLGFGVVLAWATFGTLDVQALLSRLPEFQSKTFNVLALFGLEWRVPALAVLGLLLFMGAIGKSAQFPLHVWLPFAMEAPTPVSALIHAATMVNAGVYLLVRLGPLYLSSPSVMMVIAVVGGTTALLAGIIGLTQSDIKRILAYSTISQLGFMVLACGVGAFQAAVFHLVSHGALKSYLFLSSGSALHTHRHSDPGGHRAVPGPWVHRWPLYLAALGLAIIPPALIFSGPYERLWTSSGLPQARALYVFLGLCAAFLGALYVFRWSVRVFDRPLSFSWRHVAASLGVPGKILPRSLVLGVIPLLGSVMGLLFVLWTSFTAQLVPSWASHQASSTAGGLFSPLFWTGCLAAWIGLGTAWRLHGRPIHLPERTAGWSMTLYLFFFNKAYLDEISERYVVLPAVRGARWLLHNVDLRVIDGAYALMAKLSLVTARWLWEAIDVRGIDRTLTNAGTLTLRTGHWLWQIIDIGAIDRTLSGTGKMSIGTARWLWQVVDMRGLDRMFEGVGKQGDVTGAFFQRLEPQTLQHHMTVLILWLIAGLGAVFWFVL